MPEAITEAELSETYCVLGWSDPVNRARRIFDHALSHRKNRHNPRINGDEAITVDELTAALRRQGDFTDEFAQELARDVIRHREPEFEPGDIVTGHYGATFIRQADGTWKGTHAGAVYAHLEGPLTKIGVAV